MDKVIKDGIRYSGKVNIKIFDEKGNLKEDRDIKNTVTTAGLYGILDQTLASPTLAKVGWMAVGTGTPAATLLGTEIDRNVLASKTRSNAILTMTATWAAGDATGALTEAGLFDVVTPNTVNMWASVSFAAVNKGANDTMTITWTITLS